MKIACNILSAALLFGASNLVVNGDVLYDATELTTCSGVAWSRCEEGALNWFAETLQKTYNDIHMPAKYLFDTKWVGVQGTSAGGDGGRRLQGGSGASSGGTGCSWCTDDDAFMTETDALEDHEEWATKLTVALQNSGFSCLSGAESCSINMDTAPKRMTEEPPKVADVQLTAAACVECHNVDWASLTLSEKQFVASNLERAYNQAQKDVANKNRNNSSGTSQLQAVRWEESAGSGAPSFLDYLISSASNAATFAAVLLASEGGGTVKSSGLRANGDEFANLWEMRFEDQLRKGPYSALTRADQCQVQLEVVPIAATGAN